MISDLRIWLHGRAVRRAKRRLHATRLAGTDTPRSNRDALARVSHHLIRITDLRTRLDAR